MSDVLQSRLGGKSVEFTVRLSESSLAMVHFTVLTDPDAAGFGDVDVAALQDELTEAVRTWDDRLLRQPDTAGVAALLPGVPEPYKAAVAPQHAVEDLRRIAALSGPGAFDTRMYIADDEEREPRFTLYLAGAPASLTAVLPLLQQLGVDVLDERPSEFVRADGLRCWLYDFGLQVDDGTRTRFEEPAVVQAFCTAFRAVWRGDAESDRFSALVLRAGLPWREAAVLRAYARYARQLGSPYGPQYMANTLLAHPDVAKALMALFRARFAPGLAERERAELAALAEVRGLRRRHRAGRRPHPAQLPRDDHRDAADQLVPRSPVLLVQGEPQRGARDAGAPSEVRDLRVLAAGGGGAPAVRAGGARGSAVLRSAAGLPHGDSRPRQGAGGEERGDRPGRGEGRLHRPA
jgi:glutamate dehydrogenase